MLFCRFLWGLSDCSVPCIISKYPGSPHCGNTFSWIMTTVRQKKCLLFDLVFAWASSYVMIIIINILDCALSVLLEDNTGEVTEVAVTLILGVRGLVSDTFMGQRNDYWWTGYIISTASALFFSVLFSVKIELCWFTLGEI